VVPAAPYMHELPSNRTPVGFLALEARPMALHWDGVRGWEQTGPDDTEGPDVAGPRTLYGIFHPEAGYDLYAWSGPYESVSGMHGADLRSMKRATQLGLFRTMKEAKEVADAHHAVGDSARPPREVIAPLHMWGPPICSPTGQGASSRRPPVFTPSGRTIFGRTTTASSTSEGPAKPRVPTQGILQARTIPSLRRRTRCDHGSTPTRRDDAAAISFASTFAIDLSSPD
jgi:hypothetical protein